MIRRCRHLPDDPAAHDQLDRPEGNRRSVWLHEPSTHGSRGREADDGVRLCGSNRYVQGTPAAATEHVACFNRHRPFEDTREFDDALIGRRDGAFECPSRVVGLANRDVGLGHRLSERVRDTHADPRFPFEPNVVRRVHDGRHVDGRAFDEAGDGIARGEGIDARRKDLRELISTRGIGHDGDIGELPRHGDLDAGARWRHAVGFVDDARDPARNGRGELQGHGRRLFGQEVDDSTCRNREEGLRRGESHAARTNAHKAEATVRAGPCRVSDLRLHAAHESEGVRNKGQGPQLDVGALNGRAGGIGHDALDGRTPRLNSQNPERGFVVAGDRQGCARRLLEGTLVDDLSDGASKPQVGESSAPESIRGGACPPARVTLGVEQSDRLAGQRLAERVHDSDVGATETRECDDDAACDMARLIHDGRGPTRALAVAGRRVDGVSRQLRNNRDRIRPVCFGQDGCRTDAHNDGGGRRTVGHPYAAFDESKTRHGRDLDGDVPREVVSCNRGALDGRGVPGVHLCPDLESTDRQSGEGVLTASVGGYRGKRLAKNSAHQVVGHDRAACG